MAPFVSVVGCLLLAIGVWGSMVTLHRDRPRF
jgi:hypothetical protein